MRAESLQTFLKRQDASDLAAVLLELAAEHDAVRQRLARMQLADQPDKLAASFKTTLAAWRRSGKFYDYRASREFARQLSSWLDQVAREVVPKNPAAAVTLFESFITADSSWFERADDSDGRIGDAVRTACLHWLNAAALCDPPAGGWRERLTKLAQADRYGAREELLLRADLLLGKAALEGSDSSVPSGGRRSAKQPRNR